MQRLLTLGTLGTRPMHPQTKSVRCFQTPPKISAHSVSKFQRPAGWTRAEVEVESGIGRAEEQRRANKFWTKKLVIFFGDFWQLHYF